MVHAMTVEFTLNGAERSTRVATNNANWAREIVEGLYPGAIVTLIIIVRPR